jgi:hypothetical protein
MESDWTVKNDKPHYGLKEHASVDINHGFVLATTITPDGMMNSRIAEMVKKSGYRAAFRIDLNNKEYRDLFQINRVEIGRIDEGISSFAYLLGVSVTRIK